MTLKAPFFYCLIASALILSLAFCSCKKLVQIDPPTSSITTTEVFSDSADASAAIMGIYSKMINSNIAVNFGNGTLSLLCGLSADELLQFNPPVYNTQLYTNAVLSNNTAVYSFIWAPAYQIIYQTNACIEGLQASTSLTQSVKDQFTGEAKFIRAFCHFYLVNLFGDVPYINSITFQQTSLASRTPVSQVYQQIIADLKAAQNLLRADYSISGGQRTRATQWAATALLARVYLYQQQWANAEALATSVINNSNYSLVNNLNNVFLTSSTEAILQWSLNTSVAPYNATTEGYVVIPKTATNQPSYYLSPQLLKGFETADRRKQAWLDSTTYSGTIYYYPYKYKIGSGQYSANATPTEYYMVLRLAEQYLIRAEAEAEGAGGGLAAAIADLNIIRARAGLPNLASTLNQNQVLAAIAQERRIELFSEWGHRWLDLKRTGQVDAVMSVVTPQKLGGGVWNSYQQLYPIPLSELHTDPNLTQNPNY
jgi:hypothetical protein